MSRILVVDDEPAVRESLRMLLKGDAEIITAADVKSALTSISNALPDLILLDILMPGRSGLALLEEIGERALRIPVIVLTATDTVAVAVQAMKLGAADFITKPFELEALRIKVRQLLERGELESEVARLRDELSDRQQLDEMVGRSPCMREVFRSVERIAASQAGVLIMGESGTGKELVARAIHRLSRRAQGPFVALNCGAISPELVESELFGHERGAFTGASERRIGRLEAANGGSLLLDEIGELPAPMQVKLLRALQERVVERVGSSQTIRLDVRVLAATNRDLEREVKDGRFRADLFYRINVVPIRLPPLRARREDIALLAETFIARAERREGESPGSLRLADAALSALEKYNWPGNVRELENAIEHGLALREGPTIELAQLPLAVGRAGQAELLREDWRHGRVSFERAVTRFETEILREALERADWNQTRAAATLGITRRVLKLKMDRFAIEPPHLPRRS